MQTLKGGIELPEKMFPTRGEVIKKRMEARRTGYGYQDGYYIDWDELKVKHSKKCQYLPESRPAMDGGDYEPVLRVGDQENWWSHEQEEADLKLKKSLMLMADHLVEQLDECRKILAMRYHTTHLPETGTVTWKPSPMWNNPPGTPDPIIESDPGGEKYAKLVAEGVKRGAFAEESPQSPKMGEIPAPPKEPAKFSLPLIYADDETRKIYVPWRVNWFMTQHGDVKLRSIPGAKKLYGINIVNGKPTSYEIVRTPDQTRDDLVYIDADSIEEMRSDEYEINDKTLQEAKLQMLTMALRYSTMLPVDSKSKGLTNAVIVDLKYDPDGNGHYEIPEGLKDGDVYYVRCVTKRLPKKKDFRIPKTEMESGELVDRIENSHEVPVIEPKPFTFFKGRENTREEDAMQNFRKRMDKATSQFIADMSDTSGMYDYMRNRKTGLIEKVAKEGPLGVNQLLKECERENAKLKIELEQAKETENRLRNTMKFMEPDKQVKRDLEMCQTYKEKMEENYAKLKDDLKDKDLQLQRVREQAEAKESRLRLAFPVQDCLNLSKVGDKYTMRDVYSNKIYEVERGSGYYFIQLKEEK